MHWSKSYHRRGIVITCCIIGLAALFLIGRLVLLMLVQSDHYYELAEELHTRERRIKAARGNIYDRNGVLLAGNETVCTVSVIYNQVQDREGVIAMLCRELDLPEEMVRKKVEKYSAREIIKTNIPKETGDHIRSLDFAGVKVDEDFKRYYPFGELASTVLGFTGSDNQGIIGLEVTYESVLKGLDGTILTLTDAAGIEIEGVAEDRIEPVAGNNLYLTIDANLQMYAQQAAEKVMEQKGANRVSVLMMNPQNGEILAMVNVPEFNLNEPFTLNVETEGELTAEEKQNLLNQMWRNHIISDTYEPGSTFKTITAASALEEGVVSLGETFHCPGFYVVDDRRIRCHKVAGHGTETFVQATMNSCNPVFIQLGLRLGTEKFYSYFKQLRLMEKTGVDLPGEAAAIMHNPANMGDVELATCSFGQSFQITPLRLLTTVSSIINGGTTVTPHVAKKIHNGAEDEVKALAFPSGERVLSEQTSETMRYVLEQVVAEGGGIKGSIEGYRIGGKTATSEKLPRGTGKYIASFYGFAPAEDPQIITLITIDEPEGVYYGGTIAAPVVKEIYENVLPYLGIERSELPEETTGEDG